MHKLQAENECLNAENERLSAENERLNDDNEGLRATVARAVWRVLGYSGDAGGTPRCRLLGLGGRRRRARREREQR